MPRQIALDTETTGLKPEDGHRVIEIGAVEILDGQLTSRTFHSYLNPCRAVPSDAIAIHGITGDFLTDKPCFSDIWKALIQFINGAELLIYNAPFDLGFLNQELRHLGFLDLRIETYCAGVIDVLAESRRTGHQGGGNKLEDFARRLDVQVPPGKHGALRDARLLADAYLSYLARHVPSTPDAVTVTQPSGSVNGIDLLPYLPSYALGVYRLDDELSIFKSKDRLREFGERKIRCLPVPLRDFATQFFDQQADGGSAWETPYAQDIPAPNNLQQTYSAFFNGNPYFNNWRSPNQPNSAGAENFLEIEFVKNVLARVLNDTALDPRMGKVVPQNQIQGFFVDFLIKGQIDYVIEIDGLSKLESPEAFANFLHRQNVLQDAGYKILRFGHAQIVKNWEQAARTLIRAFSKDRVLNLYLRQTPRSILLGSQDTQAACPSDLVDLFYGIQDYFALGILPKCGDSEIALRDAVGLPFPWVAMAISSLYQWLNSIRGLFETSFSLPIVKIVTDTTLPAGMAVLHHAVSLHPVTSSLGNCHEIGVADIWNHLANHRQPPRSFPRAQYRSFMDAPLHEVRDAIVPFARGVFGYNDVRSDQDKVFQRVLSGLPTLALMPTGSGKSFCYWLPSLLRPGLSIIVSPLNALMRDQLHSLQEHGINSVAVLNSEVDKEAVFREAKTGKLRMLFISPERMRIRKFREELAQIVAFVPINYLVVDEAHCVSEWGHDFRPAYLGINEFGSRLREQNPGLSLIALTATAGENVKEDMMRVLDLCEEDVVSAKQFDRANLSYQVLKVSGYKEKQDTYRRVLTRDLPSSIGVGSLDAVLAPKEGVKGVGLAFAIYANPHGKHSWQDGVPHYLQLTRGVLLGDAAADIPSNAYDIGKIRGYSSNQPTFCPNPICHSHHYERIGRGAASDDEDDGVGTLDAEDDGDGGQVRYICRDCGSRFSSPSTAGNWEAVRHENQRAFKRGELDILVSTKGFGMGIDKGSVRFAVHTHMPSGTESWYQEIGRAGRDRLHSHCVSIFDMPTAACIQALTTNELHRPSCTMLHGCNQGRNGEDWLCDYGKQHAFISASYPGHAQDVARALRVAGDLLAGRTEGSEIVTLRRGRDKAQKMTELALYRLQCIGMVRAYDIEYVNGGVKFDVAGFYPDKRTGQVNEAVASYWQRYGERIVPEERIQAVAEEACQRYSSQSQPDVTRQFEQYEPIFRQVARALADILDHVYGDILKMRYRMLFNLYEIANSDACVRKGLLTYFHPDPGEIDSAYRCEFCSSCRPDLDFGRLNAVDVLYRDDTRDAVERLEAFLESSFIEDLDAAFKLAEDLDDSREHAYGRASRFLEAAPRNLAALFMTMRFAPLELKAMAAKDLFRTALASPGIDQGFLMRCYESLPQENRPAILWLLNEVGGKFDNMPGWRWLHQEATKFSGTQFRLARMATALGIRLLSAELADLNLEKNVRKLTQRIGRI